MSRRPELAPLAAATVLSLATVVLALARVPAPDFLPYAIIALFGIAIPAPGPAQPAADAPAAPAQPVIPAPPVPAVPVAVEPIAVPVAPAAIIPGPAA